MFVPVLKAGRRAGAESSQREGRRKAHGADTRARYQEPALYVYGKVCMVRCMRRRRERLAVYVCGRRWVAVATGGTSRS